MAYSKGSKPGVVYNNNVGNGYFHRGGFRASAGSRYSEWMGGVNGGGGSSAHSQASSFAPISSLSSSSSMANHLANHYTLNIDGSKHFPLNC